MISQKHLKPYMASNCQDLGLWNWRVEVHHSSHSQIAREKREKTKTDGWKQTILLLMICAKGIGIRILDKAERQATPLVAFPARQIFPLTRPTR
jgi:hypothetical protein